MFFGWIWLITVIAGGVLAGEVPFASTTLTADITAISTTPIEVESTNGFGSTGVLIVGEERIAYSSVTATTFRGNIARPMVRGVDGSEAIPHTAEDVVRTVEGVLINEAIDYNLAAISDAAGLAAFITIPIAIYNLIVSFATTPFGFLGTDLQFISVIWGIAFVGFIFSLGLSMLGWRRV